MTAPLLRRSRFLYEFSAAACLEAPSQSLDAVTGQAATFARTAVTTALDAAGNTRTYGPGQPAYEWSDLDGDGIKEALLKLGTSDRLYYAYNGVPAAQTFYLDLLEHTVTGAASGTSLLEVGNAATVGFLSLRRATTGYVATHDNVASVVTSSVAVTVADGDRVQLCLQLAGTGSITLTVVKNTDAAIVGTPSAAAALAAYWWVGGLQRLSIGCDYSGGSRASQGVRRVRLYPGVQSVALMSVG